MHTVFALLCFGVVIHWLIFPYPSGLLHWHCGNLTIAPVPAKQHWWIWITTSCEFIMNDCITTTKQITTKPCASFLGCTVHPQPITPQQRLWKIHQYPHFTMPRWAASYWEVQRDGFETLRCWSLEAKFWTGVRDPRIVENICMTFWVTCTTVFCYVYWFWSYDVYTKFRVSANISKYYTFVSGINFIDNFDKSSNFKHDFWSVGL